LASSFSAFWWSCPLSQFSAAAAAAAAAAV